ncbi:hypothetical protein P3L10_032371 [Capsicum annuum]
MVFLLLILQFGNYLIVAYLNMYIRSTLGGNPNKSIPATPRDRVSKLSRGLSKSDADSTSPLQNSRISVEKSPRSVTSKPSVERRSPKISTPPDAFVRRKRTG